MKHASLRLAFRLSGAVLTATLLASCSRPEPALPTSADASASTLAANAEVAASLNLTDPLSFADAKRGFIAAPSGQVRHEAGDLSWDYDAFAFLQGKFPGTVNPSVWR